MDRAEGALRVAEKAVRNTQDIARTIASLRQLAEREPGQGPRGDTGPSGVGIDKVVVSDDGFGSILLTDGRIFDLGRVRGHDGRDGRDGRDGIAGRSITSARVDDEGRLALTFTDGTSEVAGKVVGPDGRNGTDGKDGHDGRDGESIQGPKGDAGPKGDKGERGPAGKDGLKGADGSTFAFSESYAFDPADLARARWVDMIDETGTIRRVLTLD